MTVLREELPQIRDACRRVAQGYSPKLSIAIAGKRYVLRFNLFEVSFPPYSPRQAPHAILSRRRKWN